MEYNKTQTPLVPKDLDIFDKVTREEYIDAIENIQFVQNLISKDRKYARDLEKDSSGKIKIDLISPHILEDMDYFRPAALYYKKHGTYTNLYPNSSPNSDYSKFWREQARRCRDGYLRESDGEWITGDHYFYLNFSPIMLTRINEDGRSADRVSDFPDIWDGDYLYFHYIQQAKYNGSHCNVLKSRGKGYSFKGGSGLAKRLILGENSAATSRVRAFAIADEKEYLTKDGVLNKFIDIVDFCAETTPFPRVRELKDSWNDMNWKMGYKDPKTGTEKGVRNEVIGVTLKNDPQKARGKRGSRIYWEEMGKFRDFLKAWQIARPSVEDGNFAFGTMIAYGTGGTEGADFQGAEEMFYNPDGYNIQSLVNVYDRNTGGANKCAFFIAEYLNRKGCYDENGNSDVVKALFEVFKERSKVRLNTSDPNALSQEKAERPITPQEAIMRFEGTVFPIYKLKERLEEINTDPALWIDTISVGRIKMVNKKDCEFVYSEDIPIREFPMKDNKNKDGAIEIYEHPTIDNMGNIPRGTYIAGCDPYDDDESSTNSLGSVFILNTFTDRIVAEYTGRPNTAKEFYENVYRLLKYYNAICNYENDKKGMYAYFEQKNALYLLADNPKILKDMDIQKTYDSGNKAKGTNSSKAVNRWGRELIKTWLQQQAYNQEDGVENYQMFRSPAALKEMISWNPDGNFDRVSSLGMLMIYREECWRSIGIQQLDNSYDSSNDDFFNRHMLKFNKASLEFQEGDKDVNFL